MIELIARSAPSPALLLEEENQMTNYTKQSLERYTPEKLYWYTFWVEGRGRFPFDMLRYDNCWPVDGAEDMGRDMTREERAKKRRIKMATWQARKHWQPTAARWSSFGWSCVPVELYEGSMS